MIKMDSSACLPIFSL